MTNGWPPYFNINHAPPINYWWIWMPLEEVKISIGKHTRSSSTMINTPWHAKIDAQELFYFMILPGGGTLIDPAVSLKTRLELYTDAHGTLIFDNYYGCSPKNHERTHRAEVGYHWLQHETTGEVILKNKTKWELSALLSSRSLDERTAVESQINGLYLTWCKHHNSVLVSKSCIRRTHCHQDLLWRYGFEQVHTVITLLLRRNWWKCQI